MADTTATQTTRIELPRMLENEPWGIWAAIVFVIATLVVAVLSMGVTGLVVVMVPAAIGMLALLSLIVFG